MLNINITTRPCSVDLLYDKLLLGVYSESTEGSRWGYTTMYWKSNVISLGYDQGIYIFIELGKIKYNHK